MRAFRLESSLLSSLFRLERPPFKGIDYASLNDSSLQALAGAKLDPVVIEQAEKTATETSDETGRIQVSACSVVFEVVRVLAAAEVMRRKYSRFTTIKERAINEEQVDCIKELRMRVAAFTSMNDGEGAAVFGKPLEEAGKMLTHVSVLDDFIDMPKVRSNVDHHCSGFKVPPSDLRACCEAATVDHLTTSLPLLPNSFSYVRSCCSACGPFKKLLVCSKLLLSMRSFACHAPIRLKICRASIRAALCLSVSPMARLRGASVPLSSFEVLACGDEATLFRPCVDCGLWTGRFCDYCYAADRVPSEKWADGQLTPLCSRCDNEYDSCHFCRGLYWCQPRPHYGDGGGGEGCTGCR